MWRGREEGNIYLNQPITFFPYSKSLRAAQISWTLFSLTYKTKQSTKMKRKKLLKKIQNFKNLKSVSPEPSQNWNCFLFLLLKEVQAMN